MTRRRTVVGVAVLLPLGLALSSGASCVVPHTANGEFETLCTDAEEGVDLNLTLQRLQDGAVCPGVFVLRGLVVSWGWNCVRYDGPLSQAATYESETAVGRWRRFMADDGVDCPALRAILDGDAGATVHRPTQVVNPWE